jgi:hypothetical protein
VSGDPGVHFGNLLVGVLCLSGVAFISLPPMTAILPMWGAEKSLDKVFGPGSASASPERGNSALSAPWSAPRRTEGCAPTDCTARRT